MLMRPNRTLAVVVALLVLAASVAGVVAGTRPGTTYDRATPEGTVQEYLSSMFDRNFDRAVATLAADSLCDIQDMDQAWIPEDVSADLLSTDISGDYALVKVRVELRYSSGLFEDYGYEEHTYQLRQSAGLWRLVGTPWPLYSCTGGTK